MLQWSNVRLNDMHTNKLRIPEQVMARQVGDETVILDLASGQYFGLDEVGSRVWALLSEGRHVENICDVLAAEYDTSREQLLSDVRKLIDELIERQLVRPEPDAP